MWSPYACVRQTDQSDCGAAALATVALHHRRPVGLQQLRDLAGTDRVGTNLLGLVQAAENLGFSARAVKGPYEALPRVPLPAVAHVVTDDGLGLMGRRRDHRTPLRHPARSPPRPVSAPSR
jgi:ATP-binding cassette subfamily B protein